MNLDGAGLLVAIDPGRKSGIALFVRESRPWGAWRYVGSDPEVKADVIVWERPELRMGGGKRISSVDDLITLAFRAGVLVARFSGPRTKIEGVKPSAWKGSLPKEVTHRRMMARMTSREIAVLPPDSDNRDAAALGFWATERAALAAPGEP